MNDNRRSPTEAGCVTIFAKSHAGKSTIINWYMEKNTTANEQKKVVVVILNGESTQSAFLSQILRALGDPLPFMGKPAEMLNRIHNYLAKYQVELLIFDESNNLRMRNANDKDATRTHNTLRGFAKSACCPIVVVGTDEAKGRISSDGQICSIDFPVLITPMRLENAEEAPILVRYCSALGIKLKQHGLFERRSNFLVENTLACLVEAAGGLPGRISRLVERAAYIARDEGADSVDIRHLEEATDLYAIPHGFVKLNPFTRNRQVIKQADRARA
ncbi:TniB family NTP-binding protein [Rhizobium leguminosarum]|uniref:TniB family NTP-binding protein n=1 Tax=Rhizobium leguminosarum TaxID=384 RepID=UPI001C97B870|nr:TniB family NTP-binding protein [Rhizobium leguminosarum]MBY5406151.1 AAA family ATPase [Rhizobium leguminosarum]